MNFGKDQTGRNLSSSHSSLLANPNMVSVISKDGGTRHSTSVTETTSQTAAITKNRAETSIMEETATNSGTFVGCVKMEGLLSGVRYVIKASWRPGKKTVYNRTV